MGLNPHIDTPVQLEAMVDQEAARIRETINDSLAQFLTARPTYGQLVEMVTRDILMFGDTYERCYIRCAAWRQYMEELGA